MLMRANFPKTNNFFTAFNKNVLTIKLIHNFNIFANEKRDFYEQKITW